MKIHDSLFSLTHFSILTGLLLQQPILENGYSLNKTQVLVKTGICWVRGAGENLHLLDKTQVLVKTGIFE